MMVPIALALVLAAPFTPKVNETLSLQKNRNAKACVVHVHRQEDKALRVGAEALRRGLLHQSAEHRGQAENCK